MFEILTHFAPQIAASDVLQRLDLSEGGYYVVSAHREENIDSERNFPRLAEVIDRLAVRHDVPVMVRSEEHTSELQSLMRITYAVFCLKKKNNTTHYIQKIYCTYSK